MKRTYESARVLVRRATGPLASHLDANSSTGRASFTSARHGLALDRWLAKRRVALAEARIERYQDRRRPIRTMSRLHTVFALGRRHYSGVGT
jgi:hypothetical protein